MKLYPRKDFLKQTAAALLLGMTGTAAYRQITNPKLAFSTIGCPDWTLEHIVSFAKENGYKGIEIRGIQRELDLHKHAAFNSPQSIAKTKNWLSNSGVSIIDLGTSAALHHDGDVERKQNLDDARRFIDLAAALDCPFIRVFPNDLPPNPDRNKTLTLIATGLKELGDHANNTGVTVLMESHGQVVHSADLLTIMQQAAHPQVGLVWDIVNMWVATKEAPAQVYPMLEPYIRHTHIKDLNLVDGKEQYTLLGKGEAPIFEGIDALRKGGYTGYYSFEWEKLWHPEIAEPEVALAHYPITMREHFEHHPMP